MTFGTRIRCFWNTNDERLLEVGWKFWDVVVDVVDDDSDPRQMLLIGGVSHDVIDPDASLLH